MEGASVMLARNVAMATDRVPRVARKWIRHSGRYLEHIT